MRPAIIRPSISPGMECTVPGICVQRFVWNVKTRFMRICCTLISNYWSSNWPVIYQLSLHYHMLAAQRHRRPILLCQLLQLGVYSYFFLDNVVILVFMKGGVQLLLVNQLTNAVTSDLLMIVVSSIFMTGATSILLSCLPIQLIPDPRFQIEKLTSMPIMHSLLSLRTPGEVRTWDNPTTWQWRDLGGLDVVAFITISNEMLPFFCGWLTRSRDHLSLEGSGDVWKV